MTDPAPIAAPRCGFVAVLGAPNVGKSTLVNRLVGAKVSIVTPKAQTTRTRVAGIALAGAAQIVLLDTPGIFLPRRRLDRAMVEAAWRTAGDADLILLVVDAERGESGATAAIVAGLKERRLRATLVVNKIDLVKRPQLLVLTEALHRHGLFDEVFMIAASNGDGVDDLKRTLAGRMPEGPWHYPEDELSDMPERLLAAEVTREQVFLQLRQELPYSAAVETEAWEDQADGSVRIVQTIRVEREGQRPIVIGKGGRQLKAIGMAARAELERMLDRRVHLLLDVKVAARWADDRAYYRLWGLEYNS